MADTARRRLIAGNWKMNLDGARARALAEATVVAARARQASVDVALIPPFPYLAPVVEAVRGAPVLVGGQDLHWEPSGAFTGAVSGPMLRDVGATHVLVGHSERRALFGDSDEVVARKLRSARQAGLTPILCVGESLEDRDAGRALDTVATQIDAALAGHAPASPADLIVAYEPVWAIGTGRVARADQASEVHRAIRSRLGPEFRILYGGSASADSAGDLLAEEEIDGLLVGSASLDDASFVAIIEAAATAAG